MITGPSQKAHNSRRDGYRVRAAYDALREPGDPEYDVAIGLVAPLHIRMMRLQALVRTILAANRGVDNVSKYPYK